MQRESLLERTLVELADTLVDDFDVVDLLTLLSQRCVEVCGVSAAGILLASPDGELAVMASSSEGMRVLELFELQAQEGPCLDCFRGGTAIAHHDLSVAHGIWPQFARESLKAGFLSVQALPMRLRGETIGALNLFDSNKGTMSQADLRAAQAFADIATIAILQIRSALAAKVIIEQLQHALDARVVIEQAKGILSERAFVNVERAFTMMRTYARNNNVRLAEVAQNLIQGKLATSALESIVLDPQTTNG
jgi:GAF domain-containing protein